jgi:hypothetical protein
MRALAVQIVLGLAMLASLAAAAPPGLQTILLIALAVALLLRTPLGIYVLLTGALFAGLVYISPLEVKLLVGGAGLAVVLLSAALRRNLGALSLLALSLVWAPLPVAYAVGLALAAGAALVAWKIVTRQPWRGPNMLESDNWRVLVLPGRNSRRSNDGGKGQ